VYADWYSAAYGGGSIVRPWVLPSHLGLVCFDGR